VRAFEISGAAGFLPLADDVSTGVALVSAKPSTGPVDR
jgi:hypothetical protein